MKSQKKYYAGTLIAALSVGAYAATFTSPVTVDGTQRTFDDGDYINISGNAALSVINGGEVVVGGAMTIRNYSGNFGVYYGSSNSVSDFGSGTKISSSGSHGMIITGATNSTINANNITFSTSSNGGDSIGALAANGNVTVNLGNDSTISASRQASGLYFNASGVVNAISGLSVTSVGGNAIHSAGGGTLNLGTNGYVEGGALGLYAVNGITVNMDNFTVKGRTGAISSVGAQLNITNSVIESASGYGISSGFSANGTMTFNNSKIISNTNAITIGNIASAVDGVLNTMNFTNGTTVTSNNGILLNTNGADRAALVLNFADAGTVANGRIMDSAGAIVSASFANGAVWNVTGQSTFDNLALDGGTINFTFGSAVDNIVTGAFTATDGTVNITLTDAFAEAIFFNGSGEFIFDLESTIANSSALAGELTVNVLTSSASGNSSWNVEDLGGNTYRLYDLQVIPESGTYAAIFGALALAVAAYRRRK